MARELRVGEGLDPKIETKEQKPIAKISLNCSNNQ
jgi:hypothetical protein